MNKVKAVSFWFIHIHLPCCHQVQIFCDYKRGSKHSATVTNKVARFAAFCASDNGEEEWNVFNILGVVG